MKHRGSKRCKKREEQRSRSATLTLALSVSDTESLEILGLNCPNCNRGFKNKAGISSHMRACKKSVVENPQQEAQIEGNLEDTENGAVIKDKQDDNEKDDNVVNSEVLDEGVANTVLKETDVLKCDISNKEHFKTKTGIMNHKHLLHEEKMKKNMKTIDRKTIDRHKRLSVTLPVEVVYPCSTCGLKCATNVRLKLHMAKCRTAK